MRRSGAQARAGFSTLPYLAAILFAAAAANAAQASPPDAFAEASASPALPSGSSEEFRERMLGWTQGSPDEPARATEDSRAQSADLRKLAISSPFGWRKDPLKGGRRIHAGVDLPGPFGAGVFATAAGDVRFAGPARGYGNLVEIEHAGGVRTRYGHLARVRVSPSEHVAQGQLIGDMGSTGRSTGVHLHYEVRVHGRPVDPLIFSGEAPTYRTVWTGVAAVEPHWTGWSDARSGDTLPQATIH
jgi:murein DD-endopeptidase MepM/ murein hydrolase activator NlpD